MKQTMFGFDNIAYPNTSGIGVPRHFILECLQIERPAEEATEGVK